MLLLYLRTFLVTNRKLRLFVIGLIGLIVVTHALLVMLSLGSTSPLSCSWREFLTYEDYERSCTQHFDVVPYQFFVSSLTIALDFVIFSLPCPTVWRLQVPKRQKIILFGILFAGVMYEPSSVAALRLNFATNRLSSATLASILSLVYTLEATYFYEPLNDTTLMTFRYTLSR